MTKKKEANAALYYAANDASISTGINKRRYIKVLYAYSYPPEHAY